MSGTAMSFVGRPPEGSAGAYDIKVDYGDGVPQNVTSWWPGALAIP